MMEVNNPIKRGFLLFPPHGVFSHIKKSWQRKYCELFKASKYGIERLEVFDNEEDANTSTMPRIITLENCIKITPDSQKLEANVFMVVTKTSTHYFASTEEQEKDDWLSAFQFVAFKETAIGPFIEEDNELYCSSGEGAFNVKLVKSDASTRCGLKPGHYLLTLTADAIQLNDSLQKDFLYEWPYCYIRRYGYCDGRFTFEAGRLCKSGEGKFLVEHPNQQDIYRSLATKMRNMRQRIVGDTSVSAGHLQMAIGMEARSRSPIPPCPGSQDHPAALRLRAASQGNLLDSIKPLISPTVETNPLVVINAPNHLKPRRTHGSLDNLTRKSPTLFHAKPIDIDLKPETAPPLQPKPPKPPRKPVMLTKLTYDNYDDVEFPEEAWKTCGVDVPTHTEDYEPIEVLETSTTRTAYTPPPVSATRPKFLPLKPVSELGNYDTLQYFGSSKNTTMSIYQQTKLLSPTSPDSPLSPPPASTPTYHDYDEVPEVVEPILADDVHPSFGSPIRTPDDSHHGYGVIRRLPDHKVFNTMEYAVVTKPRQV